VLIEWGIAVAGVGLRRYAANLTYAALL